jgi:hypothetical protein
MPRNKGFFRAARAMPLCATFHLTVLAKGVWGKEGT